MKDKLLKLKYKFKMYQISLMHPIPIASFPILKGGNIYNAKIHFYMCVLFNYKIIAVNIRVLNLGVT